MAIPHAHRLSQYIMGYSSNSCMHIHKLRRKKKHYHTGERDGVSIVVASIEFLILCMHKVVGACM